MQALVVESTARLPLRTLRDMNTVFGFERAFKFLILEKYRSLIFTMGLISVAFVYSPNDVFDSQARDIFGKSYSQGTCLLLDIS